MTAGAAQGWGVGRTLQMGYATLLCHNDVQLHTSDNHCQRAGYLLRCAHLSSHPLSHPSTLPARHPPSWVAHLGHRYSDQGLGASHWVGYPLLDEAAVQHGGYAWHGKARFRDVSGHHHTANVTRGWGQSGLLKTVRQSCGWAKRAAK